MKNFLIVSTLITVLMIVYGFFIARSKKPICDHLYWPYSLKGVLVGQRCSLCGKFNSIEDVLRR